MAMPPKTVEVPVFIKRVHELAGVLKLIETGSRDAVDLLVNTMNSKDDTISIRMKVDCAQKLLDLQVKIADTISKDQFMRQIAEVKIKGMSQPLEVGEDKPSAPRLDMKTIQIVD